MATPREKYGEIVQSELKSYYKYEFELEVTTDRGFVLAVTVGGDPTNIYKYCPEVTEWAEHEAAIIQGIEVIHEPQEPPVTLVVKAALFATQAHRDQRRKNPTREPYIVHPMRVAAHLVESGVQDAQVLAAALLHDTVEDTPTSLAQISREFGPRVASLVDEVSDDKALPKAERKHQQVEHAPHSSPGAQLVKMADAYDNMTDLLRHPPVGWSEERVRGYFVWKERVLRGICPKGGERLRALLNDLFASAIPPDADKEELLARYYAQMEKAED